MAPEAYRTARNIHPSFFATPHALRHSRHPLPLGCLGLKLRSRLMIPVNEDIRGGVGMYLATAVTAAVSGIGPRNGSWMMRQFVQQQEFAAAGRLAPGNDEEPHHLDDPTLNRLFPQDFRTCLSVIRYHFGEGWRHTCCLREKSNTHAGFQIQGSGSKPAFFARRQIQSSVINPRSWSRPRTQDRPSPASLPIKLCGALLTTRITPRHHELTLSLLVCAH
jgi:hypothetical protein